MSSKRIITFTLRILLLLAVVAIGLWAGLYFYLPHYLASRIIPPLFAETGISDFAFKIRHIGIFGADLGALRIGPEQNPALLIRSVQIDYSPKELYRQKIERMTFSGIELYSEFKDGNFSLRGIDLDKVLTKLRSKQASGPELESALPPIFLRELEIRNAVVIFKIDGRQHRIPFEINVAPENAGYSLLNLAASMYPRGQIIRTEAEIDLKRQQIILNSAADSLDLNRFSDLIQTVSDLMISGKLDLKAKTHIQLTPFKIISVDASAELHTCKIRLNNFLLQNALGSDNKEVPFKINLSQNTANEWKVSGSAISITAPIPLTLAGWHGWIGTNGKQVESAGEFTVALLPSAVRKSKPLPVEVLEALPLQGSYTAEYSHDKTIQFRMMSISPQTIQGSGRPL